MSDKLNDGYGGTLARKCQEQMKREGASELAEPTGYAVDGGPAFPTYQQPQPEMSFMLSQPGLSMRDFFAAAALTGQLTCMGNQADPEKRAVEAYRFADAMLKARHNE